MLGIAEENSSSWEEGLEGGLVWEHRAEGGGGWKTGRAQMRGGGERVAEAGGSSFSSGSLLSEMRGATISGGEDGRRLWWVAQRAVPSLSAGV